MQCTLPPQPFYQTVLSVLQEGLGKRLDPKDEGWDCNAYLVLFSTSKPSRLETPRTIIASSLCSKRTGPLPTTLLPSPPHCPPPPCPRFFFLGNSSCSLKPRDELTFDLATC